MKQALLSALGVSALAMAGCGGGGGSSPTSSPVVTPPPSGNVFTQGQFAPSSQFKDSCAAPRAGTNDRQGTDSDERFWLRSWSDELYLWYDEITDQNPANFANKFEHFDALKTDRVTASNNPVDRFHFEIPTDEYQQLSSGGASAGYGWQLALLNRTTPRDIRIAYTYGNTQGAQNAGRGAKIVEVDGVDVVNGGSQADVNTINAALFPDNVGETHNFTVEDPDGTRRSFTVSAESVVEPPVLLTRTFPVSDGAGGQTTAGYIMLTTFGTRPTEKALFDAFAAFEAAGVEELFVDLRYNGGGFLDISAEMGYMIAGSANTQGKTFDRLIFNDKYPTTNPVTNRELTPTPFYSRSLGFDPDLLAEGVALPSLNLDRVSILSTDDTCSASEALINGLVGADVDVQLVGTTTCGKPYGFYPTDNCGTTWFTIQFRGANDRGFGDFADGFSPVQTGATFQDQVQGCTIADDFSKPLGDVTENLLEYAIARRTDGACPVAQASAPETVFKVIEGGPETAIGMTPRLRARELFETGAIRERESAR